MKIKRRSRKRGIAFRPTRDFLTQAVNEYLANGGRITKIEFDENSYNIFVAGSESPIAVDEFLIGQ